MVPLGGIIYYAMNLDVAIQGDRPQGLYWADVSENIMIGFIMGGGTQGPRARIILNVLKNTYLTWMTRASFTERSPVGFDQMCPGTSREIR